MFRTKGGEHRERFGFQEAVLASFEFLSNYGLKPKKKEATFVRYESKRVFVDVYHGRSSFEIGVQVGRKDRKEKYGLDYIVAWAGQGAWESEGFGRGTMFQVSTPAAVEPMVPKVAELLKKYGDRFLEGDAGFYNDLEVANERASQEYTRRLIVERTKSQAGCAWTEKDYARVVDLYQPIREELTQIELKRLAYAEKRLLTKQTTDSKPQGRNGSA